MDPGVIGQEAHAAARPRWRPQSVLNVAAAGAAVRGQCRGQPGCCEEMQWPAAGGLGGTVR
jgi:hypothetical protein